MHYKGASNKIDVSKVKLSIMHNDPFQKRKMYMISLDTIQSSDCLYIKMEKMGAPLKRSQNISFELWAAV